MIPRDAQIVATWCAERAGFRVDPEKTYLMESRLAPVALREGFGGVDDLLTALVARRDDKLIWGVVEAMSPTEVCFFHERRTLERLAEEVIPNLLSTRSGGAVRVWNPACGVGQEIYSLAILLRDLERDKGVQLFASDLSERRLERAQTGRYSHFEIQRGLSIQRLVRYFDKTDDAWTIGSNLRNMIRWRRVNPLDDLSASGRFDVILCRGLLDQMTPSARPRLLETLARALSPDGVLVLGLTESPGPTFQPSLDHPGLFAPDPARRIAA